MGHFDYLNQLKEEQNPRYWLIDLHGQLVRGISEVFGLVTKQGKGTRGKRKGTKRDLDKEATTAILNRSQDKPVPMDAIEPEKNREKIAKTAEEIRLPDPKSETDKIIEDKLKIKIVEQKLDTPAFFQVQDTEGGMFFLLINENHPFHKSLIKLISPIESADEEELRERLENCENAIKLILAAYARMELEYEGKPRDQAREIRYEWGRVSNHFFKEDE